MCGILGIISNESGSHRPLDDQQVIAMRDTMTLRGPDDSGMFREDSISLAHRRLAIRDIGAGQQPWITQDNRFVLVFNGEIYNDDEIRADLAEIGVQLTTQSDTEALAEAWSAWGPACIQKLCGMFAFGVVDRRSKEAWIVRDRCGVKPLFYSQIGNDFVFASSIAAIRRHPYFSSAPNFSAIGHYFQTLRTTFDRQTVFENINCVRPAEFIHLVRGNPMHHTYWTLPQSVSDLSAQEYSFEEAVGDSERLLESSVNQRLKSDVPVGMMMSGGVDSNTLATLVQRQSKGSISGCCGGGVDESLPEGGGDFNFASLCAQELGIDLATVRVAHESYIDTCQSLIELYETPISTPTDAIIYQVARQLKQSVGVALGGEGADEVFCGYAIPHWSGNDFELSRNKHKFGCQATSEGISNSLIRQYGRQEFKSPADHYLSTNGLIPISAQKALFNSGCWEQVRSGDAVHQYYNDLFGQNRNDSMTQRYARVLFRTNLESLLGRLDSATMAASLEARVPFTDHRVVEQAFRFPHQFKIDVCPSEKKPWLSSMELAQRGSLRSKRVLRSVASRMMPKRLAIRPKMSFPTPLPMWLDRKWSTWIDQKLTNSAFAKEIFNVDALKELKQIPPGMAMWKWPILNAVLWGDKYFG